MKRAKQNAPLSQPGEMMEGEKEKRNKRGIRFENPTLSEETRKSIKSLLTLPEEKLKFLFWRVEGLCSFCAGTQADAAAIVRPTDDKKTLKESVQGRIKALQDALKGLDEYTKQVLANGYSAAYPHPEVSEEDILGHCRRSC